MADEEFSALGFAPGVVRGARSFGVDQEGRLTGVVFRQARWYPGVNNAECLRGQHNDPYVIRQRFAITSGYISAAAAAAVAFAAAVGQAPPYGATDAHMLPAPEQPHTFETCKCGFYGYYDGSNDYGHRINTRASGVIEGYGETLIGSRGFRASKARIVALTIHDPAIADRIRDHYWDVPVFPDFDTMVAEYPPDKGDEA